MKFENTCVFNFDGALRGMRNPKNSWSKSDSYYCDASHCSNDCKGHFDCRLEPCSNPDGFVIGQNDLELAMSLIKAGSEHRKFMRQIVVSVDITAPLYWWKEFDTYKVGTVANSTSTMHKLASTPITLDCFETDDFINIEYPQEVQRAELKYPVDNDVVQMVIIPYLEYLRVKYNETKDIKYWKELIRWLPASWLQTRTVTLTYENLLAMCGRGQRRFHKLTEWSEAFISWARTLPYAQELIFIDELAKEEPLTMKSFIKELKLLIEKYAKIKE